MNTKIHFVRRLRLVCFAQSLRSCQVRKRTLPLLAVVLLFPAAAATAQGTLTVANGTVALQNGGQLATSAHVTITGTLSTGNGTLIVNGAGTQNLTPAAGQTFYNLTVDKPSGNLVLMGDINVTNLLTITSGDLDLNTFQINLGTKGTLAETPGNTVTGASGTITAARTGPSGNVAGLGVEIYTQQDLGATTITRGHAVQTNGNNQSILRYFDIEPTNNSGLDATLIFHYDDSELNGASELTLRLFRSHGEATWTEEGGLPDDVANTVTLGGLDAFSRWTLAGAGLLPVELVSFEAQVDGQDVLLRWETVSETNNAGFEIQEISKNVEATYTSPEEWQVLGFVEGYGTTLEPQTYDYHVETLEPGKHGFRLKQIDFDGTFAYSPEVEVTIEVPGIYHLSPAYPNPFNPYTRLTLTVAQRQHVRVEVFNVLGRRVALLHDGTLDANTAYRFQFDAGTLPSGLYLMQATGERFTATRMATLVN